MKKFLSLALAIFSFFSLFLFNTKSKFVAIADDEKIELSNSAKSAILMDSKSEEIIFAKNENARLPIASMTKMMSLNLVFEAIKSGKCSLNDNVVISDNAASIEGSQAFLDANKSYKVEDLIKTVIIASANDSTVALAEYVCGNEKQFVNLMNKKANEMGLVNTHFSNSTGLPAPEHYSSAQDCAKIYQSIMNNETYKKYSKIWMDELVHPSGRKTELVNTNRLVKTFPGCDSGKTGYTNEAGYCLTCSAKRGEIELIGVVVGEPDSKNRFNEMIEMFNYGFSNYVSRKVIDHIEFSAPIEITNGEKDSVLATLENDYYVFTKKGEKVNFTTEVESNFSKAPIQKDQVVGRLKIINENGIVIDEINLISKEDVGSKTFSSSFHKILVNW